MLIWTARVSKKTKAVVAVILAGILAVPPSCCWWAAPVAVRTRQLGS